jgi:hypothetical protein
VRGERLDAVRAALDAARESWAGDGETSLVVGMDYVPGEPVEVLARKRGRRWDFGDGGRAVRLAGKPSGWLAATERVVAQEGMNVNRAGVVFVPAFERSGPGSRGTGTPAGRRLARRPRGAPRARVRIR